MWSIYRPICMYVHANIYIYIDARMKGLWFRLYFSLELASSRVECLRFRAEDVRFKV